MEGGGGGGSLEQGREVGTQVIAISGHYTVTFTLNSARSPHSAWNFAFLVSPDMEDHLVSRGLKKRADVCRLVAAVRGVRRGRGVGAPPPGPPPEAQAHRQRHQGLPRPRQRRGLVPVPFSPPRYFEPCSVSLRHSYSAGLWPHKLFRSSSGHRFDMILL